MWQDDHWLYTLLRILLTPIIRLYFRIRGTGAERIPRQGGLIIAANHQSLLDANVLAYYVPRQIHYLVTRDYYDAPRYHWLFSRVGHIPVHPERMEPSSFKELLTRLAAGQVIGLFPEGGISRDGALRPGHPGVVSVARRAQVPIVPAAIAGSFEAQPRWAKFPRPVRIAIAYGDPIPPETLDRWAEEEGDEGATARLMEAIAELLEEASRLRRNG